MASGKKFGCNQFWKSDKTCNLCENLTCQNFCTKNLTNQLNNFFTFLLSFLYFSLFLNFWKICRNVPLTTPRRRQKWVVYMKKTTCNNHSVQNRQRVPAPAPLFLGNAPPPPSLYWFFVNPPPPKSQIVQLNPKILKFFILKTTLSLKNN